MVVWIPDESTSIHGQLLSRSQGNMNCLNMWRLSEYHIRVFLDNCCAEVKGIWTIWSWDGCKSILCLASVVQKPRNFESSEHVMVVWISDEYSQTNVQKSRNYEPSDHVTVVWIPDKSILGQLLSRSQRSMNLLNRLWLSEYQTRVYLENCCPEVKEVWTMWIFDGCLNTTLE